MVRYIITERETAGRMRYGIAAVRGESSMERLDDIAATYPEILRLAVLLQENGVAEEHFRDVVEDYLAR